MSHESIAQTPSESTQDETLSVARREHERMLKSLAVGSSPSYRGPSAEGITLFGGFQDHPGNGDVERIVDEAMSSLEKRYAGGPSRAQRHGLPRLGFKR